MSDDLDSNPAIVDVNALQLSEQEARVAAVTQVVTEDDLTLDIEGVGHYTLMWTPAMTAPPAHGYTTDDGVLGEVENPEAIALAMGFALSEGLINNLMDIKSLSLCADNPKVVNVQLQAPETVQASRKNVVVNSSCGICGPRELLEKGALGLNTVASSLRLERAACMELMAQMRAGQAIFDQTGGSHAAAIFDADGKIQALAEDLGRHNALDKVIGKMLLQQGSIDGCGVLLSSRLSVEMVLKAVRAGLEIMLAVSAPTSLAIEVAQRYGMTLCGFVRDKRATVYTHPERIIQATPTHPVLGRGWRPARC